MLFQEKKMKMLSIPLSSILHPFFLCQIQLSPPHPPLPVSITLILSHTVSHPWSCFPVLSHLSLLSSPGTSMCFSLIEMHFNVVQISFLQLWPKLATWFCLHVHTNIMRVCVCVGGGGHWERRKKTIPTVESATLPYLSFFYCKFLRVFLH